MIRRLSVTIVKITLTVCLMFLGGYASGAIFVLDPNDNYDQGFGTPDTNLRSVYTNEMPYPSPGDVNGDGYFNFGDMITMFSRSGDKYGDPTVTDREWIDGDFTGDGAFTFADMLLAFTELGPYYGGEQYAIPLSEPAAIPEPGSVIIWTLLALACAGLFIWRRLRMPR